jgi:NTE family protein
MAHIGVLKVLEEVGITPDIITGTSMGSIVGGLYAIGYRADSLEQLVLDQDWDQVLSDRVGLRNVIFEEKDFFENQLVSLPLRKGKVEAPQGLIRGQRIENLLTRLTVPAYSIRDFRQFPIPFRCVAADIAKGKPVVIDKGRLSEAMRASMAIPTVFTPVNRDSMLLVDGGLIRNFPGSESLGRRYCYRCLHRLDQSEQRGIEEFFQNPATVQFSDERTGCRAANANGRLLYRA